MALAHDASFTVLKNAAATSEKQERELNDGETNEDDRSDKGERTFEGYVAGGTDRAEALDWKLTDAITHH